MKLDRFHVVTMISNPVRYRSRARLYKQFEKHMLESGVNFHVCEVAFGERPHFIETAPGVDVLKLRTKEELWIKENALNLMVQRLPTDWKYVAWLDADIEFLNPNREKPDHWAREIVEQLQHYEVVQCFRTALDLGPRHEVMHTHKGFVASYLAGEKFSRVYGGWHPGYAWAARRSAWNAMGGMFEHAILGSGDDHFAKSLIGRGMDSLPNGLHANYYALLKDLDERAARYIRKNIGFAPLTLQHFYHGAKRNRQYWSRWDILKKHQFDPLTDIKKDWQGLWQLDSEKIGLRDDIRAYFRSRSEDDSESMV